MSRDTWYSLPIFTFNGDIAAEMVADTARTIMRKYRSPKEHYSLPIAKATIKGHELMPERKVSALRMIQY